jgi:hypothetical protein
MKRAIGRALTAAIIGIAGLGAVAPVAADHDPESQALVCPAGFQVVSLKEGNPHYWNETFVTVFGSKDVNENDYVCAKWASGFRNLTVVDDK